MKTVVITGGSAGIGKATALLFSRKGYKVYELSRSGKSFDNINHITADVTDQKTVKNAFEQIFNCEKNIDILINNAGFGISGPVEFTDIETAKKQFDVNFHGTVNCCREAIPYLRKTKGKIINISSVAANFAIPFQGFYSASKAAINSITLCLANELRPFGIKVCAISPGDVKTEFTNSRQKLTEGCELYGEKLEKAVSTMEKDEISGMPPEKVAKLIYKAALKKNPAPFYTTGIGYKFLTALGAILPSRLKNYIVGKLYG